MRIRYLWETYPNDHNGVIDLEAKRPWGCIVSEGNKVGASFCNPGDIFSKKRGRQIAIDRLQKGKTVEPPNGLVVVGPKVLSKKEVFEKRLEDVRREAANS
jgi:hypothetical protein